MIKDIGNGVEAPGGDGISSIEFGFTVHGVGFP